MIVLSDRLLDSERAAIRRSSPPRRSTSTWCGPATGSAPASRSSGEPREVHHIAALIGYGASAVNPYVMLDTVADMADENELDQARPDIARWRAVEALNTGS